MYKHVHSTITQQFITHQYISRYIHSMSTHNNKTKLCVLSGPTGIGKTSISIQLAQHNNTSIISADSVQCYKYLDVGSNKISTQLRELIRHYCIDIYDIKQLQVAPTVADWYQHCIHAIESITDNNSNQKIPLVVGGAGFHIRWLLYGETATPKSTYQSKQYANTLLQQFQSNTIDIQQLAIILRCNTSDSIQYLHDTMESHNPVRMERCVEILHLTNGIRPNNYNDQISMSRTELQYDVRCFYLYPRHKAWLHRLVNYRCECMVHDGLITEVLQLESYGIHDTLCSLAIGYRQTIEFIHNIRNINNIGDQQLCKLFYTYIDKLQSATRQYIRRQGTWFRNESLFDFIEIDYNISTDYHTLTPQQKIQQLSLPSSVLDSVQQYIQSQIDMSYHDYLKHTSADDEMHRQYNARESSKSNNDKSVRLLQSENVIYYNDGVVLQLLHSINFNKS